MGCKERFCQCKVSPLRGVLPALAIALVASGCSSRLGQFTGSLRDVPNNSAPAAIASGDLNALAQRYDARRVKKRPRWPMAALFARVVNSSRR